MKRHEVETVDDMRRYIRKRRGDWLSIYTAERLLIGTHDKDGVINVWDCVVSQHLEDYKEPKK